MKEEKIFITNKKNQKIAGILSLPEVEKPPIVIMIHGFKGDKTYYELFNIFSERLCKEGFAVLRIDCRGSGESDGEFIEVNRASEVEDLRTVLDYVKTLDIDKDRIGVAGTSMGAIVAVMGYNEDIKCLVLFNTAFKPNIDYYKKYEKELHEKGYFVVIRRKDNKEFKIGRLWYEETMKLNITKDVKKVRCPTICIVGSEDYHTPEESKNFIDLMNCAKDFKVIGGGKHVFRKPEVINKAIYFALEWLKKYLK